MLMLLGAESDSTCAWRRDIIIIIISRVSFIYDSVHMYSAAGLFCMHAWDGSNGRGRHFAEINVNKSEGGFACAQNVRYLLPTH
jgi:hypothetical protein